MEELLEQFELKEDYERDDQYEVLINKVMPYFPLKDLLTWKKKTDSYEEQLVDDYFQKVGRFLIRSDVKNLPILYFEKNLSGDSHEVLLFEIEYREHKYSLKSKYNGLDKHGNVKKGKGGITYLSEEDEFYLYKLPEYGVSLAILNTKKQGKSFVDISRVIELFSKLKKMKAFNDMEYFQDHLIPTTSIQSAGQFDYRYLTKKDIKSNPEKLLQIKKRFLTFFKILGDYKLFRTEIVNSLIYIFSTEDVNDVKFFYDKKWSKLFFEILKEFTKKNGPLELNREQFDLFLNYKWHNYSKITIAEEVEDGNLSKLLNYLLKKRYIVDVDDWIFRFNYFLPWNLFKHRIFPMGKIDKIKFNEKVRLQLSIISKKSMRYRKYL